MRITLITQSLAAVSVLIVAVGCTAAQDQASFDIYNNALKARLEGN